MSKIKDIQIAHYKLPLEGNLVDALHGKHDFFELITATVTSDSGVTGQENRQNGTEPKMAFLNPLLD